MKLPRLKEVRELHGWSQKKLAEESGVSRDSISNYETGQRDAWPATAKRLADALGVEIADLTIELGKAEAPPSPEAHRDATGEERRIRSVPVEELDSETSRLKEYNERRQRQIAEYDEEGAPLPERGWWNEVAALEESLTREYEERGILGYVEEVLAGRRMSSPWPQAARACVKFYREFFLMRSFVDEARFMVFGAESQIHEQVIRHRSAVDAYALENRIER